MSNSDLSNNKSFFKSITDIFKYSPKSNYNFSLSEKQTEDTSESNNKLKALEDTNQQIFPSVSVNLDYIKVKYNFLINSDIKIREFKLVARDRSYNAFILYIDGMCDSKSVSRFILHPLMLRNRANTFNKSEQQISSNPKDNTINIKKIDRFDLTEYIHSSLIPQNDVKKFNNFEDVINSVNAGECALFVDTLPICFVSDIKGFEKRAITSPTNEVVIRGAQEGFVESIRTNTSMLRRFVNNENLVIEDTSVGVVSKTKCAICYIKNIANESLISEVKYRINNLDVDYVISSGQLEQLIKDNTSTSLPETIATERPDNAATSLLEGRVVILINGSPICLIVPCTFLDLLYSPEDKNINHRFSNMLRLVRLLAVLITLLLPGLYIAITNFHEELIPTELLFSIIAARKSVPFSITFEILIMEITFELIREAGIRVPSPIGSTMGIVGALVLGEAAVNASIVSPITIIIVAITGLASFAIPNYYLEFQLRISRFVFMILGAIGGFLGISLGIFIYLSLLCNYKAFGISYFSSYTALNKEDNEGFFVQSIWKREKRNNNLNTNRVNKEGHISMKWKNEGGN